MRSLLLSLTLAVVGCAGEAPVFPDLGGDLSDAEVVHTLRARTELDSFYAVLSIDFESPERDGTFDVVMHYQAPASFRFTAFKDLIVSIHDLFDLVITPERFALRYTPDGEDEMRVFRGPAEDLPAQHPRFRGFCWAAHAFFLPGVLGETVRVQGVFEREVLTRLANGVPVRWVLDPDTLEVRSAVLAPAPGVTLRLSYSDYERAGDRFFPRWVTFKDPSAKTSITARPSEYEVNPALDAGTFELDE